MFSGPRGLGDAVANSRSKAVKNQASSLVGGCFPEQGFSQKLRPFRKLGFLTTGIITGTILHSLLSYRSYEVCSAAPRTRFVKGTTSIAGPPRCPGPVVIAAASLFLQRSNLLVIEMLSLTELFLIDSKHTE